MGELLAILGLALACGGWVLLQRWAARGERGGEAAGGCGACGCDSRCEEPDTHGRVG